MAMVTLELKFYLEKNDTDLSNCILCEEIIYSKMYCGVIEIAGEERYIDLKLCESCASATEIPIKENG